MNKQQWKRESEKNFLFKETFIMKYINPLKLICTNVL
jgi:hypothetical protein